jgi:hypothetical protein
VLSTINFISGNPKLKRSMTFSKIFKTENIQKGGNNRIMEEIWILFKEKQQNYQVSWLKCKGN